MTGPLFSMRFLLVGRRRSIAATRHARTTSKPRLRPHLGAFLLMADSRPERACDAMAGQHTASGLSSGALTEPHSDVDSTAVADPLRHLAIGSSQESPVGPPSTPNAPPEYLDSALTATSASDPALVNWWPLQI